MPFFSNSVKDSSNHPNRLEKAPPPTASLGRSASVTTAKGSVSGQHVYSPPVENQSTRAVAGSTAMLDDLTPVETQGSYAFPGTTVADNNENQRDSSFTLTPAWRENPEAARDQDLGVATVRQKVEAAVEAELAADKAIEAARRAVHEARSVVSALEQQAHAE